MIQFDRVGLGFSGHPLFEDVSFSLQKGERCGLVGRNGSGKSTLFRLISGAMEPDKGSISIPRDYRIGFLQQHIHFTKSTLREEAALGLPPGREDELYKAEKILFGLGFTEDDLDKSPSQFSGGFHLRLHLAKAIVSEPDCLLLDEPTNYLDILSIRWLASFFSRWRGEFILISHDRDFMDSVTTHTMGIHRGKVRKYKGTTIDFYQQVLLEEEVHERTRIKTERKRSHAQVFIDRFGAKATKAAQAQSRQKLLARVPALEKLNEIAELSFSFHEVPFPGRKMVDANGVQFSFTSEPLIPDFSLSVEKGERIAFIGKNGRGKSTLLRLFAQDLEPQRGTFTLSDNTRIGYFGQTHIDRLNPQHNIEEEIALANPALTYSQIKRIAGTVMFSGDLSTKKISILSGGERSRVLLGKILAKPCNLLLLDEPTHHLDIESIEALIDALEDFSGSLIIVTHSELILRRLNLHKIVICGPAKQTLFLGNYDEFLEKLGWEEEQPIAAPKSTPPDRNPFKLLEKQIRACEKAIITLEGEQQKDQALLEQGVQTPELLRAFGQRQTEIDKLFAELEQLHKAYEQKKKS